MANEHTYHEPRGAIWGAPYRVAVSLWRRSPKWLRSGLYNNPLKKAGRDFLARFARRDDLYGEYYYAHMDATSARSAPTIANSVVSRFGPRRVIDVGCGSGALLAQFAAKGVDVKGLEYSDVALEACKKKRLDARKFDIEQSEQPEMGAFDVSLCFEVAEHVASEYANRLVDMLIRFAPRVIFTAATPGQGGTDHVNEQPHEYWIAKFEERGYPMSLDITGQWREEWKKSDVAGCYWRNIMVFEKRKTA